MIFIFLLSVIIIAIIAYQKGNQPEQQYYFLEEIFNCFLSELQPGLDSKKHRRKLRLLITTSLGRTKPAHWIIFNYFQAWTITAPVLHKDYAIRENKEDCTVIKLWWGRLEVMQCCCLTHCVHNFQFPLFVSIQQIFIISVNIR